MCASNIYFRATSEGSAGRGLGTVAVNWSRYYFALAILHFFTLPPALPAKRLFQFISDLQRKCVFHRGLQCTLVTLTSPHSPHFSKKILFISEKFCFWFPFLVFNIILYIQYVELVRELCYAL